MISAFIFAPCLMPFLLLLKPAYLSRGQPTVITAARFRPMINYIRFQNWLHSLSGSCLRPPRSLWLRRRDAIFHREQARCFQTGRRSRGKPREAALGHTYYLNYGLAIHFLGRGSGAGAGQSQGPRGGGEAHLSFFLVVLPYVICFLLGFLIRIK